MKIKDMRTPIVKEMDSVIICLENKSPSEEDYTTAVNNLKTLQEIRSAQDEAKVKILEALPLPDPNALIKAGVLLVALAAILEFEKDGIIHTKAFGLLPKIF